MAMAGRPKMSDAPAPVERRDQRDADQRHDHRADIAARDVGADREPAPFGRELLGEQAVADRMLGRAADPPDDVGDRERDEVGRERLDRDAAAEHDPAGPEQVAPRHDPGERRVTELDQAGRERADRGQEGHRLHADPELVDDLDEDQRQQRPPGRG